MIEFIKVNRGLEIVMLHFLGSFIVYTRVKKFSFIDYQCATFIGLYTGLSRLERVFLLL